MNNTKTYIIVNDEVIAKEPLMDTEDPHDALQQAGAIFIEETGEYTFNKANIDAKEDRFLSDDCAFINADVNTIRCIDNTNGYDSLLSQAMINGTSYIAGYGGYAPDGYFDPYNTPGSYLSLYAVDKDGYQIKNWDNLEVPLSNILAIAKYEAEEYLRAEYMTKSHNEDLDQLKTTLNSSPELQAICEANPSWNITFMNFHGKLHLTLQYVLDGTAAAFCNLRCYEDDREPPNWKLPVKKLSVVHFTTYNYVDPQKCPGLPEALTKLQADFSSFPDYFKIKKTKTTQGEMIMKNCYLSKNALSEEDVKEMTREEILDWLYHGGSDTPRQKLGEWDPREDTLEEYLAEIVPVMIESFEGKITVKDSAKYLTSIWNAVENELTSNKDLKIKEDIVKGTEKIYDRELGAAIAFGQFMARENLEVDSLEDAREVLAAMRQDAYAAAGENMPSKDELPNEMSLEYAISFGEHMYLQDQIAPKGITAVKIFKTMEKDYQKNHSYHYFSIFAKERIEGYFKKAQNKTKARPSSTENVR